MTYERESDLTRAVLDLLGYKGAWACRTHGRIGNLVPDRPGIPDILACYHGRFIGLELKAKTGRLAPRQVQELLLIGQAGGLGKVVRDLDDVSDLLAALESRR